MLFRTLLCLCLILPMIGQAQANDPRLAPRQIRLDQIPVERMPALDNTELRNAEMARRGPGIAPKFAESIEVDIRPTSHGIWEELSTGIDVWRLKITSPGALSLNLGFLEYYMPKDASLLLYSPDYQDIMGPFTPADNEVHNELWTPVLPGDQLILELQVPKKYRDLVRLRLKSVNHDYLGFGQGGSQSCNLDIICGDEDGWAIVENYRDIIQSVGVYGFNGGTFCTGFLINNGRQDCTPYFMTANHCGVSAGNAASVVVYWNYFNSECRPPNSGASGGPGDGLLNDANSGTIFRASHAPSDMVLVELDDPVSETANAFFAGWTTINSTPSDTTIAIHHPNTEEKRISFAFTGSEPDSYAGSGFDSHVRVFDWEIGSTEGGSSGSPLFNADKQVIGQLHGGGAACGNNLSDWYGWFSVSWEGGGTPNSRLRDWLDPDNLGLTELDGRSQQACGIAVFSTDPSQNICASDDAIYDIQVSPGFENAVSLSVNNLPDGLSASFGSTSVNPGEGTNLTISNTGGLVSGTYVFQLIGDDGSNNSEADLIIVVEDDVPAIPAVLNPTDGTTGLNLTVNLDWNNLGNADAYDVQLSTNPDFSFILFTASDVENSIVTTDLLSTSTTYYWRVRAKNICGDGDWSTASSFTTANVNCAQLGADDLPVIISEDGSSTVTSSINISFTEPITNVGIQGLRIDHSFTGDLSATLTSPDGTVISLFDRVGVPNTNFGCGNPNVLLSFSDTAPNTAADLEGDCGTNPALFGDYQPIDPFSSFNGEDPSGNWTLSVTDNAGGDGGSIEEWFLDFCTEASLDLSLQVINGDNAICSTDEANYEIELGPDYGNEISVNITTNPAAAPSLNDVSYDDDTRRLSFAIGNLAGLSGDITITILVEDANGNSNTITVPLSILNAPSIPALDLPVAGATLTVEGPIVLEWTASPGATGYDYIVATDEALTQVVESGSTTDTEVSLMLDPDSYFWQITATNECGNGTAAIRSFSYMPVGTYELGGFELKIWPNPSQGPVYLEFSQALTGRLLVELYDIRGQRMFQKELPQAEGIQALDLNNYPAGSYLLRLRLGQEQVTERIILLP